MPNRTAEILEETRPFFDDPFYLPEYREVVKAFGERQERWSKLGAYMGSQGLFFCEYYTQDYIEALVAHLEPRMQSERQTTILEVGAGAGRLSKALGKVITDPSVTIVATDRSETRTYPDVEKIDYREALKKYQPQVVLSAWMPYLVDWTPGFRRTPSVEEYLLIGESGSFGASGTPATWDRELVAADGFSMTWLHELGDLQLNVMSCFDDPEEIASSSTTVSFVRE